MRASRCVRAGGRACGRAGGRASISRGRMRVHTCPHTCPCPRQLALTRAPGACVRACSARGRVSAGVRSGCACAQGSVSARARGNEGGQMCMRACVPTVCVPAGVRACGCTCGCERPAVYVCICVQACGDAGHWVRWRAREKRRCGPHLHSEVEPATRNQLVQVAAWHSSAG